jgi:hypothetical protein
MTKDWIQHWSTVDAYIAASHVEVNDDEWGDPIGLNYSQSGIGPRFSLIFNGNNSAKFYWIEPDHDWRLNQTYRYKLTNSWINDDNDKSNWYFWNINAFVDSEIQIPRGYNGFSCDYVEFSYWKERTHNQVLQESDAKIQFYDFKIGFLDYTSQHVYRPCRKIGGRCRAIDGIVTCGSALYWKYGVFGFFGFVFLFCCLFCQYSRSYGADRDMYSRVAPQEDERDEDDETIVTLQSLKENRIIELTGMSLLTESCDNREDFEDEF